MKILITGADGLLGNNLVRECILRNYDVSVMLFSEKISTPGLDGLPLNRFFGNILDESAVRKSVEGHDIVIHLAASTQINPPRNPNITEVNVTGTRNIIQACKDFKVKRLIHVGTANSFGPGTPKNPGSETSEYVGHRYRLDYFDSKQQAQQLVLAAAKSAQLNALVVNPTFMIGPYDTKPSSGELLLALYHQKVPICTPGSKTYIAVKDAAVAICNSIELGESGNCYILGNENHTYQEFFQLVSKTLQFRTPQMVLPAFLIKLFGILNSSLSKITGKLPVVSKEMARLSSEDHCYSGDKAREKLKMPHTPLAIAIEECFDWFLKNGYTQKK